MKKKSPLALRSAIIGATIAMSFGLVQTAAAQTNPQPSPTVPAPPQPNLVSSPATKDALPLPGANSFTKTQVVSRLNGAGYVNATGLTKDKKGIWRGKASKGGQQVSVAVDFKGNIVETR